MVKGGIVHLVLLFFVGIGCTESGTPSNAAVAPSPSLDGDPTSSSGASASIGINGPLTGEIWVTNKFGSERVNLQTGESIKVSNERAYPSKDGSVYVEFLRDVGQVDGNCSVVKNYTQQINVIDTRSREVLHSFVLDRDIQGPLRLSPDGKRIAMRVAAIATERCEKNDSDFSFSVFSTDGKELFRNSDVGVNTLGIKSYDWHPNGRLMVVKYVEDRDRFVVQLERTPGTYRFDELGVLGEEGGKELTYTGLRIGPLGNDAVVEKVYDVAVTNSGFSYREASPLYFSLVEATENPEIFQQSDGEIVNSPVFSPDGKFIMVTRGFISGGLINYTVLADTQVLSGTTLKPVILLPSTYALSYVVPTGVMGERMPPQGPSENLRNVFAKHYSSGELSGVGFDPIDGFSWTPAID